jgi:Beta-lactamase class C and other penicillin binding proteins
MLPLTLRSVLASLAFATAVATTRANSDWPLPTADEPAAAGFSRERLDTLHRNLRDVVDAGKYSGYILALARDGEIVDFRAHGHRDLEARAPMQKDSIVKIFSMSKIITSTAVLMLMEEGRLRLGDPAEKYLPALANRKVLTGGTADAPELTDATRPFTIRDLLTHTAGYYYDEAWSSDAVPGELMRRAKIWEASSLDDFIQRLANVPLHEQPGTRYRYGINTDILGAIVEKVSGQPLDQFLQQRIFAPLNMRDTSFWVPAEKQSRLAKVYQRDSAGKLVPNAWANAPLAGPDRPFFSGGGGLYSTASDYLRFAQMLLNGGELDGARIFSRKTVELMTQNHIAHLANPHPFNIPSQGFGLGVRILTDLGQSTLLGTPGTFGWDGAATTKVEMDPAERLVSIVLFQHVPFNQDDIFATWANGYYSALID